MTNTQTNLKTLAAEFNLFQVADIPAQWLNNESYEYRIQNNFQKIPDFLKTLPGYEVGLFYHCENDTDYKKVTTYYIEHSYILLKKEGSKVVLLLREDRSKKYWFHPYYRHLHKYHNVSYHIKTEALKGLNEPNYIGVFTEKKVNDWAQYCEKYIETMDKVLAELNDKNKDIENEIQSFIDSIEGCEVSRYQNKTDIDTPLFRVIFEHFKDQKYLSTKIDFKGSLSDITNIEANKLQTA